VPGPGLDAGGSEIDLWQLAAAGPYTAALCMDRRRGSVSIKLSRDAGRTFVRLRSPFPTGDEIVLGADGTIGITRAFERPMGLAHFRVAVSRDLGRIWRVVLRSGDYLGSGSSPSLRIFGRSLRAATGQMLWRSDDAGTTWHETSVATLVG
jgi:hypothetical protein